MTTIVLVRHGATPWSGRRYCGHSDPALSAEGRRAVELLAPRLAATLPAGIRIVTSPSRRAHETAAIIAAAAAPSVVEADPRWMEADLGDVEGLTFDEIDARSPVLAGQLAAGDIDIDWPAGETAAALGVRVTGAWAAILETGRPTLVVSHAGPLRVAMALGTGRPAGDVPFLEPAEAVTLTVDVTSGPTRATFVRP
jgi:broad specificity phosphatase PhoE